MAILEVVEAGHEHVEDLRHELGVVRGALDRTDAILGVTDEALERAEQAIESSRRVAPVVLAVVGVAAIAVTAAIVWRSRRRREQ
jgi:cobalamin biosynthesis Mg chelatase CobN